MRRLRSRRLRFAAVSILAGACLLGALSPAFATEDPPANSTDWGTVVPDTPGPQADAWIASVKGLAGLVNTTLFEAHDPATPDAPKTRGGLEDGISIPFLGYVSALGTVALANKLPAGSDGAPDVPMPGAAYAKASGGEITIGLPYVPNPFPGGTQLSPVGLYADGIQTEAKVMPGKPVAFSGKFGDFSLSSFGFNIISLPLEWPVNFGVRIPQDRWLPAIAEVMTKEEVTTNSLGQPTKDSDGNYVFDPKATAGYVNAGHVSVLGTDVADATVGHAAVMGGAPLAPPTTLPKPPVTTMAPTTTMAPVTTMTPVTTMAPTTTEAPTTTSDAGPAAVRSQDAKSTR
ncbi:MAG TPA: hypothetical protein VF995_05695 [Actinomycetota bacterium]